MKLVHASCESSSVEDCVKEFKSRIEAAMPGTGCYIESAELELTFGAFMHLSAFLLVDPARSGGGVVVEYSVGRSREAAIERVIDAINSVIRNAEVVSFKVRTYTTPVTRKTYAVGIVAYNVSPSGASPSLNTVGRRTLLHHVLSLFDYNPRVLNISELARVFGVSRDSIYYDIEQILKERERSR